MSLLAVAAGVPVGVPVITSPVVHQAFQRDGSNKASIPITGSSPVPWSTVEARLTPVAGGTSVDWTQIASQSKPAIGSFSYTFTNMDADDYILDVRTRYSGSVNGIVTVSNWGIGDMFLGVGQSGATNQEETPSNASDPRACAYGIASPTTGWSTAVGWQAGNDPFPVGSVDNGSGSIWSFFLDGIISATNLRAGIAVVAAGGTLISQWEPGGSTPNYYSLIRTALQYFGANGIRSALLDIGATDGGTGTSTADWEASCTNMIDQSRVDAGWTVPWGVGISAFNGLIPDPHVYPDIVAAQTAMQGYTGCYAGANVDTIPVSSGGTTYRFDGNHYALAGQSMSGGLWAAAVISQFGF